jgi:Tfp pilus assembly protein PilO
MALMNPDLGVLARNLRERFGKDPRWTARAVLGLLLLLNLVAAAAVFKPWGGSEEEVQSERRQLRLDLQERRTTVNRLRAVVQMVEKTRAQADQFFGQYFLDRQTAYSTVLAELNSTAEKAGIRPMGDNSYNFEAIEGSDNLAMMTVNGSYQGTYADLIEFVNAIDRSPRFLTIDRLQASPAQAPGTLSISLRLNVFVRGEVESQ